MTSLPEDTRLLGSLRALDDRVGAVRMEDVYDTDVADLWSALTDPERLARWIATVDGDLRLGGTFAARFTSTFEGPGRIDVCEAPHRLQVTMNPGTDEETVIEAIVTPDGDRARLVVEERGLPLGVLAAHGAGWQAHVEDLAAHLAGREQRDWKPRWESLIPAYRTLGGAWV
jgi:uncharacterized protein YndB with AHSA1/START domain